MGNSSINKNKQESKQSQLRSLEDFLGLLRGVKKSGNGYTALCPSHHDTNPSLRVIFKDNRILVKCLAGCETTDVLASIGLTTADLFLDGRQTKLQEREVDAVYHYTDANGKPFEVVRTRPKGFYQRRPDGKGDYINNLKGIVPTLYHRDELKQAIEAGRRIHLVEGEKDADNLRDSGLVATTNPGGAGKWRESYSKDLSDADLVIIPDNDNPGRDHVNKAAKSCHGIAKRIRLLTLPSDAKDLSDWLNKGGSAEQLERLLANCSDYEPPAESVLPEILVGDRQLRDVASDALEALYRANDPPQIFRRGSTLARIATDEFGRPYIEVLNKASLKSHLTRGANFYRRVKDRLEHVWPPDAIVEDCLAVGDWNFPPLLGITEAPVIRPDGTVMNRPGYDSATNLYYYPTPKLTIPPIPDKPTDNDVKAAIELALEPLADFPFDTEASRANAIGTMFTPILRPMMAGPVPLALFDKPQQGTGASLLAEVISLIATGRPAAMMPPPKNDEEWNKIITVTILKGQSVMPIDNIESQLQSPSLATLLTATTWRGRILGRSEDIVLPNIITPIATGNNIRLGGDLPRRSIWVRMDACMARPWLRDTSTFKHPHLIQWVSENRGAILAAILTIARAWVMAGMVQGLPNLGGYESYSQVVGGVLAYMGLGAFLDNLDAMYNEADIETPQWEAFLEAWHDTLGDKAITAAELISYINDNAELRATLPDTIADTEVRNYIRRLGNALAKKKGVRYANGFSVIKPGEYKHAATWLVVSPRVSLKDETHQAKLALGGESGESGLTPAHARKTNDDSNRNPYKDGPKQDSPDSPIASKTGESGPENPSWPAYADLLGMDVPEVVNFWEGKGRPGIEVAPGNAVVDLHKFFARPDVNPEHLLAIKEWLLEERS